MVLVALDSTLDVLEPYGLVAPTTATGPLRQEAVKFGDGLFVEEGTTNLITNPNFELNTNGWSTAVRGDQLEEQSSVRAWVGTKSAKVTADATGLDYGHLLSTSFTFPGAGTYTASAWFYAPDAATAAAIGGFRLTTDASLTGSTVVTNNQVTAVAGKWVRASLTFTVDAGDLSGTVLLRTTTGGLPVGASVWMDAVQVEAKAYATSYCDGSLGTGYSWSSTAHASTSTRAASVLTHPIAGVNPGSVTLAILFRAGYTSNVSGFPTPIFLGTAADGLQVFLNGVASGAVSANKGVSSTTVGINGAVTSVPGDLILAVLKFDGATLSLNVSKNGAAVVTQTVPTTTISAAISSLTLGPSGSGTAPDGPIEQVLVWNRVLSAGEIATLAARIEELTFKDDPTLIFAANTGIARNKVSSVATAGTGAFRTLRSVSSTGLSKITERLVTDPGDDNATYKISVAGGSGIGQGQYVQFGTEKYLVRSVFAAPGFDNLYLTAA